MFPGNQSTSPVGGVWGNWTSLAWRGGSNSSLPVTVKRLKQMKPGSLLRCTEGEMAAIKWRRGGSRGSDFDYKGNCVLAQGPCGVSALHGFEDSTALRNLARIQHGPFLEQKVGLGISWGPCSPKDSVMPTGRKGKVLPTSISPGSSSQCILLSDFVSMEVLCIHFGVRRTRNLAGEVKI